MLATQPQFDFIKSLIATREWDSITSQVEQARALALKGQMTKAQASSLIDSLKACPEISLEGMHVTSEGVVYKCQRAVHGSGNLYAKRLNVASDGTACFEYESGATRMLSKATRMTKEQAAEFGHLYGVCCNCGRTLTDETSIAQGYGPVCAQYFA